MSVSDTEAVKRLPAWSTTSAVLLGFSGPPGRWAAGFDPRLSPGWHVPPPMDPHIPVYVQCLFQSQLFFPLQSKMSELGRSCKAQMFWQETKFTYSFN